MTTTHSPKSFLFDNRPELRTSYSNQRALAARELPIGSKCIHDEFIDTQVRCTNCAASGTVLFEVPTPETSRSLMFRVDHAGHDLRTMYRTDGSNTRYLFCRTCNSVHNIEN